MKEIEEFIIDYANYMCSKYNRDYPDYDKNNPITSLSESLAIIVEDSIQSFQNDDFVSIDDFKSFFSNKLNQVKLEEKVYCERCEMNMPIEVVDNVKYCKQCKLKN